MSRGFSAFLQTSVCKVPLTPTAYSYGLGSDAKSKKACGMYVAIFFFLFLERSFVCGVDVGTMYARGNVFV